jgi:molecular chaperone DnaJ
MAMLRVDPAGSRTSAYEVLAASRDAHRTYRTLARWIHPDVSADPRAAERFEELRAAYEELTRRPSTPQSDAVAAYVRPPSPPRLVDVVA